jgi:hypothetical protein
MRVLSKPDQEKLPQIFKVGSGGHVFHTCWLQAS